MARRPQPRMDRDLQRASRDKREKDVHKRVEALLTSINERQRVQLNDYDAAEALMELEEARMLAMNLSQPQAAVNATVAKAKVMGLIVDRAQVMQGKPSEFRGASQEDEDHARYERIRERIGTSGADRFMAMLRDLRKATRGDDGSDA